MSRMDRRRSQWHFSDSGSRFDKRRLNVPVADTNPISSTFSRKIIYCRRCNNRVVSNVSHCPFCGKNLLPIYRRLWFWLIFVILIAVAAVAFILYKPQFEPPAPPSVNNVVIGAPADASAKDLRSGTTVDCDSLLVTMVSVTNDLADANNVPIFTIEVQMVNKSSEPAMLYLTQWQVETSNGVIVESLPAITAGGETIKSELDYASLAPGGTFTTKLYFTTADAHKLVFAPNGVPYSDENLVTWVIGASL